MLPGEPIRRPAHNTEPKIIQDDTPIWGADRIAREIGLDRQATYHLLSGGLLPAKRIGRRWVSSRTRLRQALTSVEQSGS
jgi:hypothetical protein